MALIRITDYEFTKVDNIYNGILLFLNTVKLWRQSFSTEDFSPRDSRGCFGVSKQQLAKEDFWNAIDGYTKKEVVIRNNGHLGRSKNCNKGI